MNDFPFQVAVIVLLVLMKAIRWPYRRQVDRKASWPAMKKHPLDTAMLGVLGTLFSATLFAITANWFIGLLWFGGVVLLFATRIPQEEAMMIAQFGDRYRQYMQRTGRLLPRFALRTRPPNKWKSHAIFHEGRGVSSRSILECSNFHAGMMPTLLHISPEKIYWN